MNAEQTIEVALRAYPSIYPDRQAFFRHALLGIGTGYIWSGGELVQELICPRWKKMERLVKQGKAPTPEQCLEEYEWAAAMKYCASGTSRSVQVVYDDSMRRRSEQSQIPPTYSIYDSSPVSTIPDDIHLDWLQCCIEVVSQMCNAKTNFDATSILAESDRKLFEPVSPKVEQVRRKIAEDIIRETCAKIGKTYVPITDEERAASRAEWERLYSPRARAERANNDNTAARKRANEILNEIHARFWYYFAVN